MKSLVDKLEIERKLEKEQWVKLINSYEDDETAEYLFAKARGIREQVYGKEVYIRGLVEISNHCKNDCLYCGIRKSNTCAVRYRLDKDEILCCCRQGYELGMRTFVLQGGEDFYYDDQTLSEIIAGIKKEYPDCAVTLSLGERTRESYKKLYDSGAERYLLRHETANDAHYKKLHPAELSLANRKRCLYDLKEIGYQVGCGFMVGSPFQTAECLAEDMIFMRGLEPHMVGIGPFIPHHDTPFRDYPNGSVKLTVFMLALTRVMLPNALIPATTALGTICPGGRKLGILSGANVVMPNLSPKDARNKYMLYDNKLSAGAEAAEGLNLLREEMREIGYQVVVARGDYKERL